MWRISVQRLAGALIAAGDGNRAAVADGAPHAPDLRGANPAGGGRQLIVTSRIDGGRRGRGRELRRVYDVDAR